MTTPDGHENAAFVVMSGFLVALGMSIFRIDAHGDGAIGAGILGTAISLIGLAVYWHRIRVF